MKYLICNLKANFTFKEILEYKKKLEKLEASRLIVCPSFCFLPIMYSNKFLIGAQDVSEYGNGSYTGKVTARMLKSIGVSNVLLNHYELNDKRSKVLAKLKKCLKAKLNVFLFLSEDEEENNYQYSVSSLIKQVKYYLNEVKEEDYKYISFIYEPNWLIGKECLSKEEIENIIYVLKAELKNMYGYSFNWLYGGGVNEDLVRNLSKSNIDGFVVGNNSLDVDKVVNMVNILNS